MQVVFVTGAAKRIGKDIALYFAKKGNIVVVHYNKSQEEALDIEKELKKYNDKSFTLQADFESEESYKTLIECIYNRLGRIDVLINNASIFEYDNIYSCTKDSFDRHVNINLWAPIFLTKSLANLKQKNEQNVIMILDQKVLNPTPNFLSYTISKNALLMLTKTLAVELAPLIRVNAICPGPTYPNNFEKSYNSISTEDHLSFEDQIKRTLLKRQVGKEDICKGIEFLIENKSIVGTAIPIDCGQNLFKT